MSNVDSQLRHRGGRMRIPRSRGAASGFLLILLGAWGALIPFVGPYFDFAYTPGQESTWTTARAPGPGFASTAWRYRSSVNPESAM